MPSPSSISNPSIPSLVRSCKTPFHLHQLHANIIRKGLEQDHFIISHFLSLSSSLPYSLSIFDRLLSPSTILYNILIKVLSQQKSNAHGAISLFIRMKRSPCAFPDRYTYPSLFKSCSHESSLKEGETIHGSAIHYGVTCDAYVGFTMIDFYGKCKKILSARKMFDEMSEKNVVSWTAMVFSYVNVGDLVNAEVVWTNAREESSILECDA